MPSPPPRNRDAVPRNIFPIIGKLPKIFSNHWKNWPKFSNHWKKIFQSLENFSAPHEPPDCAKPTARKRLCPSPAAGGKHGARGGRRHGGCREGASRPRQPLFRSLALVEEFGARGCPSHKLPIKRTSVPPSSVPSVFAPQACLPLRRLSFWHSSRLPPSIRVLPAAAPPAAHLPHPPRQQPPPTTGERTREIMENTCVFLCFSTSLPHENIAFPRAGAPARRGLCKGKAGW